jgi:peptidoglycan/xylan/chitin deacetylase (PgdA/CDA1 family)
VRQPGCYVLTYHRTGANRHGFKTISADVFRDQMRWLRSNCTPIAPAELRSSAVGGDRRKPPVLVTFDDGYRDYHDVAYPILREQGIPAINFVSTYFIDSGAHFWWDIVDLALQAATKPSMEAPWEPGLRRVLDSTGRPQVRVAAIRWIKAGPDAERDTRLGAFLDALGVRRTDLGCERQVMNWDEVRAVAGLTVIGAHTHTHPLLSRIGGEQLTWEIEQCRDRIAAQTGGVPRLFAYPGGAVTPAATQLLYSLGFEMAFGAVHDINTGSTDWMDIRRMHAPSSAHQLAFQLSGLWSDRRPAGTAAAGAA